MDRTREHGVDDVPLGDIDGPTGERDAAAGPRILIVNSQPEIRGLLVAFLQGEYTLELATDGPEALASAREAIDLVLLERTLPTMSAAGVLERLREQGYDGPVVLLGARTASPEQFDRGFDDFVCKPFERGRLVQSIEYLLALTDHDEAVRELFTLARKRALVVQAHPDTRPEADADYVALDTAVRTLRERLHDEGVEVPFDHLPTLFPEGPVRTENAEH